MQHVTAYITSFQRGLCWNSNFWVKGARGEGETTEVDTVIAWRGEFFKTSATPDSVSHYPLRGN